LPESGQIEKIEKNTVSIIGTFVRNGTSFCSLIAFPVTESVSRQIVAENEGESLIAAQAIAYYRAVKQAGKAAPYGQFFNHAEKATHDEGRNFMRNTLQQIAQEEIDEVEKKRRRKSVRTAARK
jgi:hypothetical protein